MAEYIDREALLNRVHQLQGGSFSTGLIVGQIEKAPTADVVEVVRCEGCKYCTQYEAANGLRLCKCDYVKFSGFLLDDYCSYGERKE